MHLFLRHLPSASSSLRTSRYFPAYRPRTLCFQYLANHRQPPLSRFNSSLPAPVPTKTWVDRLPPKARPYLYLTRIDKPIGTLLLFYPCGQSSLNLRHVTYSTPEPITSMVNLHGVLRPPPSTVNTSYIYQSLWNRCTRHARSWMHDQRYVG